VLYFDQIISNYRKCQMGIDMGIDYKNSIDMGVGMQMAFENRYELGNNSTRPIPIPSPSLIMCRVFFG